MRVRMGTSKGEATMYYDYFVEERDGRFYATIERNGVAVAWLDAADTEEQADKLAQEEMEKLEE